VYLCLVRFVDKLTDMFLLFCKEYGKCSKPSTRVSASPGPFPAHLCWRRAATATLSCSLLCIDPAWRKKVLQNKGVPGELDSLLGLRSGQSSKLVFPIVNFHLVFLMASFLAQE